MIVNRLDIEETDNEEIKRYEKAFQRKQVFPGEVWKVAIRI